MCIRDSLGKLVAWQKDLASRFGEERILKGLTLDTIASLSEDVVYIDSILALSPNDSATWIALRALKADTLENEVAELKGYLDDEQTDSRTAYLAIAYDLNNLTTTNDLEAYLKEALLFKTQFLIGSCLLYTSKKIAAMAKTLLSLSTHCMVCSPNATSRFILIGGQAQVLSLIHILKTPW